MSTENKPDIKSLAFYKSVLFNDLKDERRRNATAAKYTYPAGDDLPEPQITDESIESAIIESGADQWLQFIQNPKLHAALKALNPQDMQLVYWYFHQRYTHDEIAEHLKVSRQCVRQRLQRIYNKIRKSVSFYGG